MRATFTYSVARILLFAVALGLLYLAGARGLLLVGLALVASGIVSFVVLSRLRDRMSGALTSRIRGFRERLDDGSRAEDDDLPAVNAGPVNAGPVNAGPVNAGPVNAVPADAVPVDAVPVDAPPVAGGPTSAGPDAHH
jgi:Protein of unknown function (DUF4229)